MKQRSLRVGAVTAVALLLAHAVPAHAQVYYVTFKDAKTAKRFPTACITVNGEPALVGEAKAGVTFENGRINYQGDKGNNEFWVVNTSDPSLVPYKLSGDAYVPANAKSGTVSLTGSQIAGIQFLMRKQSLYGLAREYQVRKDEVDAAQKARDACKAGTPPWSLAHARLLGEMEQLHSWLDATAYPEAAKKLAGEIDKQRKGVAKEAYAARLASALASVALVPTPEKLVALGKQLAPETTFHVQESRHLRCTYDTRLPDEQVKELLLLAEKMIDGFRTEFVDPWLGDDFPDQIPDERFMEIWFGPDDPSAHERFLTDWYGLQWGDHKAERIAALSGRYRRSSAPEYLDYWKIADNKDFDAIVAHQLGHVLANLHCNAGRRGDLPTWIEEGAGYWLALAYLGKNSVTCKEFKQDDYAKPAAGKQVERAILMGESELFTRIALEHGAPADQLLREPLHKMEDADLAKAWSLFEWVGKEGGKKGQLWLRALCEIFAQSGPSLTQFRAKSEEFCGVTGEDVFKTIDERWRKRAEALASGGAEPRKQ